MKKTKVVTHFLLSYNKTFGNGICSARSNEIEMRLNVKEGLRSVWRTRDLLGCLLRTRRRRGVVG